MPALQALTPKETQPHHGALSAAYGGVTVGSAVLAARLVLAGGALVGTSLLMEDE